MDDLYGFRSSITTNELFFSQPMLDKTKYLVQNFSIVIDPSDADYDIYNLEMILSKGIYSLNLSFGSFVDEYFIDLMKNGIRVSLEESPESVIIVEKEQIPFECLFSTNIRGVKYYGEFIPFNIDHTQFIIKNSCRFLQKDIIFNIIKDRMNRIFDHPTINNNFYIKE